MDGRFPGAARKNMRRYLGEHVQLRAEQRDAMDDQSPGNDLLGVHQLGEAWGSLMEQSYGIFRDVQKVADSTASLDDAEFRTRLLAESTRYILLLEQVYQDLFERLEIREFEKAEQERLRDQLDSIGHLVALWRLFQIVFIEHLRDASDEFSVKYIQGLLRFRDSLGRPLKYVPQMPKEKDRDNLVWRNIRGFVLLGQFSEAVNAASYLSQDNRGSEATECLVAVLEKCPLNADECDEKAVYQWRSAIKQILSDEELPDAPEVLRILQLLLGELAAWTTVGHEFTSWLSFYVSRLLHGGAFASPQILAQNLQLLSEAFAACPASIFPREIDLMLESMIKLDWNTVSVTSRLYFKNTWFTVHAFDMMYQFGTLALLTPCDQGELARIREETICDYVIVNVSPTTWLPFVRYLKYCPGLGEQFLKDLLAQRNFDSLEIRREVESALDSDGMSSALVALIRRDALEAIQKKDFHSALQSAASADEPFLISVSNEYLTYLWRTRGTTEVTDADRPLLQLLPEVVLLRLGVPGLAILLERARKDTLHGKALFLVTSLCKRIAERRSFYSMLICMADIVKDVRQSGDGFDADVFRDIRQLLIRVPLTNLKPVTEAEKRCVFELEKEIFGVAAWSVDEYSSLRLALHIGDPSPVIQKAASP